MLVVAIVLPTADTVTDVRFGATLVSGTYDQPWKCNYQGGTTTYDHTYLDFGDTNPSFQGR